MKVRTTPNPNAKEEVCAVAGLCVRAGPSSCTTNSRQHQNHPEDHSNFLSATLNVWTHCGRHLMMLVTSSQIRASVYLVLVKLANGCIKDHYPEIVSHPSSWALDSGSLNYMDMLLGRICMEGRFIARISLPEPRRQADFTSSQALLSCHLLSRDATTSPTREEKRTYYPCLFSFQ